MHTLTHDEAGTVAGGLLPLLATLGLVASHTDEIRDFFNGFFDGLSD